MQGPTSSFSSSRTNLFPGIPPTSATRRSRASPPPSRPSQPPQRPRAYPGTPPVVPCQLWVLFPPNRQRLAARFCRKRRAHNQYTSTRHQPHQYVLPPPPRTPPIPRPQLMPALLSETSLAASLPIIQFGNTRSLCASIPSFLSYPALTNRWGSDVTSEESVITLNVYDRAASDQGFLGAVQIKPVLVHEHTVDQWYKSV
jgi:hypothetical protein